MTRKTQRKSDLVSLALDLHRRLVREEANLEGLRREISVASLYHRGEMQLAEAMVSRSRAELSALKSAPPTRALKWITVEREDQVPVGTLVLWSKNGTTPLFETVFGPSAFIGDLVLILALPSEIPPVPEVKP